MLTNKFNCRYYICCSFLLSNVLGGCFPATDNSTKDQLKYFDLNGFINEQVVFLSSNKTRVLKTISKNGLTEKKELPITNWEEELALFKEHDLNKPAWLDSYDIDTVVIDNLIYEIHYRSNEPELTTCFMNISLNSGEISSILIKDKIENILYSTQRILTYLPDAGYRIEGTQKVRFMDEVNFAVDVMIIK